MPHQDAFPIMGEKYGSKAGYVPIAFMKQYEAQAQHNHGQTLERLSQRGGLCPSEAMWLVEGVKWRGKEYSSEGAAWIILKAAVRTWLDARELNGMEWSFEIGEHAHA